MDIKALLPSLNFLGISKDSVDYYAGMDELSNLQIGDLVEISFYHDGTISFTFSPQGNPDKSTETCYFHTKPTALDLYNFVERAYA